MNSIIPGLFLSFLLSGVFFYLGLVSAPKPEPCDKTPSYKECGKQKMECRGSKAPISSGTVLRHCKCDVKRGLWFVKKDTDDHLLGFKLPEDIDKQEEDGMVCTGCFAGTIWECDEPTEKQE